MLCAEGIIKYYMKHCVQQRFTDCHVIACIAIGIKQALEFMEFGTYMVTLYHVISLHMSVLVLTTLNERY